MEVCLLLLAATAVQAAGSGGSPGVLPSLKCGPSTRRGRRLGRLKPVQLPSSCQQRNDGTRSAALCDEPGDDYPWEAIDNYLRQSSDFVKKRVENTLKAGRISAPNALRRRRGRSTDDGTDSGDVRGGAGGSSDVGGVKPREKKHVDAPPGNLEASGDGVEDKATDPTSISANTDLTLVDNSLEVSGSGMVPEVSDNRVASEDELDAVVSFFLENPNDPVTKDALKDMLQFRRTFSSAGDRPSTATTAADEPATPYDGLTPDLSRRTSPPLPTLPTVDLSDPQTDEHHTPPEASDSHLGEQPDVTSTTTPSDRLTDVTIDWGDLHGSASERRPVAALPEAQPLVAQPPTVVRFNRPTFPARQRVTVAKTTALPAPTPAPPTYEPQLDDFAELVYATPTQRRPTEAEVSSTPARTTARPQLTVPTLDPYTESSCPFREEIRSPFYAMNTRNEWKTLINMPNYESFIHMEHCVEEKSQGRCAEGCRCTQKYTVRTMPVYDTDANGCDIIYMDKFLFASHCDCKCLPFGYTLFKKPPPPTTPVPDEVGVGGAPPQGWLPERPAREGEERETEDEELLSSRGRPEKLDLPTSSPGLLETQGAADRQEAEQVKAGSDSGLQRRPVAGHQLPTPRPGAPPNGRWEALTRRQTDGAPEEPAAAAAARPSRRNRQRRPPAAPRNRRRR